jgi:hypothetical protein
MRLGELKRKCEEKGGGMRREKESQTGKSSICAVEHH